MWGNDNNQQAYQQVYEQPHEAKMSHELLGGAAAFMAMREYEKHQAKNGNPPSHAFVKEMLAGIAGAEVDRLAETKGMDYMDREKAKRHAKQQAEQMYEQSGMYNRDLPEQHDDWQQGQGYQAYQQSMGGGGGYNQGGYNQGGFNQGMGGGGGFDQGMGGGGGFNQGGGGYGGQQMGYGNQGGYDGNMNQNNQMSGGYGGQQEPHHHHHHHQQEY